MHAQQAVIGLAVHDLLARGRKLGADEQRHDAANEHEEQGHGHVLNANDLVVGVDPEVLLPVAHTVERVVLGRNRATLGPCQPVVKAADAVKESHSAKQPGDRGHDVALPQRVETEDGAHHEHEQEREQDADNRRDDGAAPPEGHRARVLVMYVSRRRVCWCVRCHVCVFARFGWGRG